MPFNYYPQMYQPIQDNLSQYRQMQAQNSGSILWVDNYNQAKEYLVAPNSAVVLWDSNNPYIYLKSADSMGKTTIKSYELKEADIVNKQYTASDNDLIREIETIKNEIELLKKQINQNDSV